MEVVDLNEKSIIKYRGNKTAKFLNWASKTLFTDQLGTTGQKTKLAIKLLGVDNKSLIDVLNSVPST